MRVVSLLTSATELLCEIGGEHLLVGRSHECDYPVTIRDLPVLTRQRTYAETSAQIDREVRQALADETVDSLYALDGDLLGSLSPDVILTQDLCDVCSIDLNTVQRLAQCMEPRPRLVSLNPSTIEDVFDVSLPKTPSVRPTVVRAVHQIHFSRWHQLTVSPPQVTPAQGTSPMYANV